MITTDVGGNREIIVNRKYGLVTPKQNPKELALAMAYLLDNMETALDMAKAGREYILENHLAQARNRRIFDLYLKIARSKGHLW